MIDARCLTNYLTGQKIHTHADTHAREQKPFFANNRVTNIRKITTKYMKTLLAGVIHRHRIYTIRIHVQQFVGVVL